MVINPYSGLIKDFVQLGLRLSSMLESWLLDVLHSAGGAAPTKQYPFLPFTVISIVPCKGTP
jgi:hypothetical protein